jgi:hypothetical protein
MNFLLNKNLCPQKYTVTVGLSFSLNFAKQYGEISSDGFKALQRIKE